MTQSLLNRLGVRDQSLSALSMCKADKHSFSQWLEGLPTANIGETTKQLYALVEELLKLQIPADSRLELLEIVEPPINSNIHSLARHYQHKQAILPKKAQQVVDLTHALRMCLANNFTLAAIELSTAKSGLLRRPNRAQTARAIYGAMQLLKDDLLLCYQLYSAAPRTLWLKLHQLYRVACELDIQTDSIRKSESKTIHSTYLQCLLQGSIKANQLRQDDLMQVVDLMPTWLDKININRYESGEIPALFMINPDADRGPVYSHILSDTALSECRLQLSTSELVQYIRHLVEQAEHGIAEVNGSKVRIDLLNHLILAWGKCTKRSFMRIESEEELEICVGLGAAHKFAAGETDMDDMTQLAAAALARTAAFEEFHSYEKLSAPLEENGWESSAETTESADDDIECIEYGNPDHLANHHEEEHLIVRVKVNNASPGGYSFTLPQMDNLRIHAGDLIGVKDAATELWSIATIRWLHRPTREELTFGVELLSPAFVPSVARSVYTEGDPGQYFPVLMLPEVTVMEQSASLLVSNSGMESGQVLQVLDRDEIRMIRLAEQISKTRAYSQYEYENFDAANDGVADSEDLFESLWGNL